MKEKEVIVTSFKAEATDSQFDYPKLYICAEAVCLDTGRFASIDMSMLRSLVQDAIKKSIQQESKQNHNNTIQEKSR